MDCQAFEQRRLGSEADWVSRGSRGTHTASDRCGEPQALFADQVSGITASATITGSAMQTSKSWLEGSSAQRENAGRQVEDDLQPPLLDQLCSQFAEFRLVDLKRALED